MSLFRSIVKPSDLILSIGVFLTVFLMVFLSRYTRLESPQAIIPPGEILLLADGGTFEELVPHLTTLGFMFNEDDFLWAKNVFEYRNYLPGRYEFSEPVSFRQFLFKLSRGIQDPMKVVIGGGLEVDRFIQRVSNQFRFGPDELAIAMADTSLLRDLNVENKALIGRMLPNTYEMYWTITPEQFIRRMMQEFDKAVLTPYSDRAKELDLTIDEVTTLASIIEWEVRYVDEKPRVSGLYWNRLNRRMLLQADPTVAYAIGERRRLFFSDYRVDHPYNTYRVRGLPPGPINNPRLTSIQAALYPEQHNYLFMVATPEGYHAFTTNYNDHLRESRKWTAWLREQRQIRERMELENAPSQGSR
jgi:UPF0755 protein